MIYPSFYLADVYGAGSYDCGNFDSSSSCAATTANGGTTSSNVLTNTGFDIALGLTLACVIIFVALVVKFWRRGNNSKPENLTN